MYGQKVELVAGPDHDLQMRIGVRSPNIFSLVTLIIEKKRMHKHVNVNHLIFVLGGFTGGGGFGNSRGGGGGASGGSGGRWGGTNNFGDANGGGGEGEQGTGNTEQQQQNKAGSGSSSFGDGFGNRGGRGQGQDSAAAGGGRDGGDSAGINLWMDTCLFYF